MINILDNKILKQAIFDKFVKEIESIPEKPCENPYDLSEYKDKKTISILNDIDKNRNHSWIKELWNRNRNKLDMIAIIYRGQKFTYKDFFIFSYVYAASLKSKGFKKGQEFVCAIENTPEFPFIMGATSLVGGRVNLTSAEMDIEYLVDMVNRAEFPYVFVSDMSFAKFSPVLKQCREGKFVVPISIDYSLKNGNPYKDITEKFYKLDDVQYTKTLSEIRNVYDINDLLNDGINYIKDGQQIIESSDLNDKFTTTYTSGSTGWKRPKALVHKVRSYITMGRYHDSAVSGIPTMEGRTTLALCKTMSDTDFMSNISDTLMQGGILALEPINDKEYFLTSLLINKPTLAIASRSYWVYLMKEYNKNSEYKKIKLPFLLVPTAAGEPMSEGEEKALNKWLRSVKAGIDITKVPFTTMSLAGGDSEHGGIFLSLFRALQSKSLSHVGINEPIGMKTYNMVVVKALRKDGTYCDPMEPGQLVANSPCTMSGYVNNEEENNKFFIKDAYGKQWANLNTYGYIDKTNHIYVKGRISQKDGQVPNYIIQDIILKDTKRVMSCEVININDGERNIYIAHIEPQASASNNIEKLLEGAKGRCSKMLGDDILSQLYFRIHSNEESFELLHTGKRNNILLIDEGISSKCIKASDIGNDKNKTLVKKRI